MFAATDGPSNDSGGFWFSFSFHSFCGGDHRTHFLSSNGTIQVCLAAQIVSRGATTATILCTWSNTFVKEHIPLLQLLVCGKDGCVVVLYSFATPLRAFPIYSSTLSLLDLMLSYTPCGRISSVSSGALSTIWQTALFMQPMFLARTTRSFLEMCRNTKKR